MTLHATLGASSTGRWMNCPGSIRLIDALPEYARDSGSVYADQGTAAHDLGHVALEGGWDAERLLGHTIVVDEKGNCRWIGPDEDVGLGENAFPVDQDMVDAVQVYLDEIRAQKARLSPLTIGQTEVRLDMTWLRPNMFGTADFVAHEPYGELVVTDYKHGAGVVVEVEWNTQAMYYGLAALHAAGGPGDVEKVTLVIVQPRAGHRDGPVRRWTISSQQLWAWKDDLARAADATAAPDAPVVAGDWCRFCPAKATCPAIKALVNARAKQVFSPLAEAADIAIDATELAEQLASVPLIEAWCKGKTALAASMLKRGLTVPGYKLVRKRSDRRWVDPDALVEELRKKKGVRKADYTQEKVRSPAQLEKVKAIGKPWVKERCEKPEGGLTMVPEADRREAVAPPAIQAFSGVEIVSGVTSDAPPVTTEDGPGFLLA